MRMKSHPFSSVDGKGWSRAKIIFISTPSVYFTGQDRYNIGESDPLPRKQFNYEKTKLMAEKDLLSLCPEGFQVIIFRPRAIYGPYDRTIVPRILQLSQKKRFPLINQGKALMDITYVGNLIDVIENSISAPHHAWNDIYNRSVIGKDLKSIRNGLTVFKVSF